MHEVGSILIDTYNLLCRVNVIVILRDGVCLERLVDKASP